MGLSPLARGNRWQRHDRDRWRGPIPAGAGEPPADVFLRRCLGAYPRWRGGTPDLDAEAVADSGLSPLARGNRIGFRWIFACAGPIPAGAGEPDTACHAVLGARAYPRWRGGTKEAMTSKRLFQGLSPLARGNLHHGGLAAVGLGPIPAGAGEPGKDRTTAERPGAYPRWRGGTALLPGRSDWVRGLSPLARGNLSHSSH